MQEHSVPRGSLLFLLPILTLALLAPTSTASHGAASGSEAAVAAYQRTSILSGTYSGTVIFEDDNKTKLDGAATLTVMDGRRFKLAARGERTGEIVAVIASNQLPGGHMRFDNDREFSIRWIQCRENPQRLKIVSAKKECINFRFCSDAVDSAECTNNLKPPC